MTWRDKTDPAIKDYLEALIKSTQGSKESFSSSGNKANAQLWTALSIIYKQTFNLDQRIKYIEKLLKEVFEEIKKLKEQQEIIKAGLIQKPEKNKKKVL